MDRLKTALQIRDMPQRKLAKLVGVTEVTMSRYVNGSRKMNSDVIIKICKELHISADWLLGLI